MNPEKSTGVRRLVRATVVSLAALKQGFIHEEAIRLEIIGALIFCPLGFWLGATAVERVLLVGSILLILLTELLNTGIEAVVDRVGSAHHELSGLAKDMGSAAVLVALVIAALTWGILLFARFNFFWE